MYIVYTSFRRVWPTGAWLLAALLVGLSTGCYTAAPPHREVKKRVVTDDLGRPVELPERVDDVVSLVPGVTETIYAIGAGSKLVGVSLQCDHPAEARSVSKAGDPLKPNIETIVAMKPQVVFASAASRPEDFIKSLDEREIKVMVIDSKTLDDVFASIERIGEVLGQRDRAADLVDEMKTRTARVASGFRPYRPKVFVQIAENSLEGPGRDSFVNDLITRSGGIPAEPAAADPDVIVIAETSTNREPSGSLRNSAAVKNRRVYRIRADILLRPGPRLADAIDMLSKHIEDIQRSP